MKKFVFILFFSLILFSSYSQRWKLKRYDVFIGVGTINLTTDLGVSNSESTLHGFRMDFTRPCLYLGARYKFSQSFSGKFSFAYGYGHSKDISNVRWTGTDGFVSNTHIVEPSVIGEYYLIKEQKKTSSVAMYNRRGMINDFSSFGVYVSGGLSGVIFKVNHEIIPRATDKVKNSGVALALPLGLGLKYVYSDRVIIGYEVGPRFVFSDFLDGIKPAASKSNDMYWFSSIHLAYKLKTTRKNIPQFLDKGFRRAIR